MSLTDWALSVKPGLVQLQRDTGIPALFAAAQMCHESAIGGGSALSKLAADYHNYAGLKSAPWQRQGFDCGQVRMSTWEEVKGQPVDTTDSFCVCHSWEHWLKVYAALLTGDLYGPALKYAADPLLYGVIVGQTWATDSRYGLGLVSWMSALWPAYADTLPGNEAKRTIPIKDGAGRPLCNGFLATDTTLVPVRALAEAMGLRVEWQGDAVALCWPGAS